MRNIFICAMIALMAASCQSDSSEQINAGKGKIAITATTSGVVTTRGEGIMLQTPQVSDFSLEISGVQANKSWSSIADYKYEEEYFTAGNYTVAISYGDSSAEGYNLPCFSDSKEVEVLDRNRTTKVAMTAKLANAIVTVQTTEAFDNYFPVSNFTITTASNVFEFDKQATDHLFVAAGQAVAIDCTCIRQSNLTAGTSEKLATQTIPSTAATTRYVLTYDLSTAGGVNITVKLNDTTIDTIEIDNELNPNA